jgi:hypothetical protein
MTLTSQQQAAIQQYIDSDTTGAAQAQLAALGGDYGAFADNFINDWTAKIANVDPATMPNDAALLDAFGYTSSSTGSEEVPVEQAIGNTILNNYVSPDLAQDAQRRVDATNLLAQYQPQIDASNATIASLQAMPNWKEYLSNNPDVAQAFNNLNHDASGLAILPDGSHVNQEQWAQYHYENWGQKEGRAAPTAQSAALTGELAASQQAAIAQQAALDTQTAARAQSLKAAVDQMGSAYNTFTAEQKTNLAAQVAKEYAALNSELTTKKAAIETQLATLGTAIDANSVARKGALQEALNQLNIAQQPLNEMRERAAKAQMTAVNLGVESTTDQILADAAKSGYIGGSSATDANLARATIAGRQNAANAMGTAQVQNATDNNSIAQFGAQQGYGIGTDIAAQRLALAGTGATQNLNLSNYGAEGNRSIASNEAGAARTIADTGASNNLGLAQFGATQGQSNADYASGESRNIADTSAQRNLGFFSNDLTRRLAALSLPSAAINQTLATKTALDQYGQSGLERAKNNLSFLQIGQSTAPTQQTYLQQANTTTGSALQNAGAGLVSLAGSIGNANGWFTPTKTATPTTTYSDFLKNNPTSPAATGGIG